MQILKNVDPAAATGKTKKIFDGLEKHLGMVPNLMRALANSPAALNAYVSFDAALSEASLAAEIREQIAIAVATLNSCDYCLSAHTLLGRAAGVAEEDLEGAQRGEVSGEKARVAVRFARELVKRRGLVPVGEIGALRAAGFTDGEIAEMVAVTAVNIFTNYFNNVAGTEIDFPVVRASAAAAKEGK